MTDASTKLRLRSGMPESLLLACTTPDTSLLMVCPIRSSTASTFGKRTGKEREREQEEEKVMKEKRKRGLFKGC